ncbi:mg735 protein [Tupanvirus deep ocean]|uniref:Mg735 protein n=2 Tax=Tupanvirus TaxID=2094720 RepID=A0AC62A768_9VIRU|nr:mg735 protein [Tupanvirus deep ocean]QKU33492.1 mg735 protein [Tupanvirus deep ocean]
MIDCYCDASYSPDNDIAILGWVIGNEEINIKIVGNTTNTRAELLAIVCLLNKLAPNIKYTIYTDCQGIIERLKSKDKLISKKFLNRKGVELSNADLYKQLFALVNNNITIKHIEGHIASKLMSDNNKKFSMLDKHVRNILRETVRTKN